ncbi:aspartyl-phosphate phosphatase Spo0E family protein [Brevibacillus brevis]|uniref:aspartyl-phosphate phosphatase Spo0E family protein n=1 Tax=Brevibacillus brevis TaxID=1393 RepID=UPI00339942C0
MEDVAHVNDTSLEQPLVHDQGFSSRQVVDLSQRLDKYIIESQYLRLSKFTSKQAPPTTKNLPCIQR